MENKVGFFEEAAGVKSNIRLNGFILLWFFIAYHLPFGWANAKAVLEGRQMVSLNDNQLWFDLMVLSFVFIPKAVQKLLELRYGNSTQTNKT